MHNSLQRSDSGLSHASNILEMEHLENSSNMSRERSIAIERLSGNSRMRPDSSSSSIPKPSNEDSSYERFNPQIYLQSQQEEQHNPNKFFGLNGLNGDRHFSSSINQELGNSSINDRLSSFNENMEKTVSEPDYPQINNRQEIFEGGS